MESRSSVASIQTQLGNHNLDVNESRLNDWTSKTLLSQTLTRTQKANQTTDDEKFATQDIAAAPKVIKTVGTFAKSGAVGALTLKYGGSAKQAGSAAVNVLSDAGKGSKIVGTGATAAKDLGGVEGIIGGAIKSSFGKDLGEVAEVGAEGFAKTGAKALGNIGAVIDTVSDIDNLVQSKGKSLFNKGDTTAQDVGNIGTILAGGLDIAAALTGGLLAPVAALASIAVAGESTVADIQADDAQKKTDDKNIPPSKPPAVVAPPAFAQLGFLSNTSHDPTKHISN